MRLEFSGVVDVRAGDLTTVGPRIGDRDVVGEIEQMWPWRMDHPKPQVTVYLGIEPIAEGPLWAIHGFGGTEVTPPESPEITVGDFNLLHRLDELDGREVVLVVEDRPKE